MRSPKPGKRVVDNPDPDLNVAVFARDIQTANDELPEFVDRKGFGLQNATLRIGSQRKGGQ